MTHRNKLMSKRNALIQDLRRKREEMKEAARTEHRTRFQKVHQLAADLGVSRESTPHLFRGVMRIVENDNSMELFFITSDAGRRIMIEHYSDGQQLDPPKLFALSLVFELCLCLEDLRLNYACFY